jgi:hypothetical protein
LTALIVRVLLGCPVYHEPLILLWTNFWGSGHGASV